MRTWVAALSLMMLIFFNSSAKSEVIEYKFQERDWTCVSGFFLYNATIIGHREDITKILKTGMIKVGGFSALLMGEDDLKFQLSYFSSSQHQNIPHGHVIIVADAFDLVLPMKKSVFHLEVSNNGAADPNSGPPNQMTGSLSPTGPEIPQGQKTIYNDNNCRIQDICFSSEEKNQENSDDKNRKDTTETNASVNVQCGSFSFSMSTGGDLGVGYGPVSIEITDFIND